jgi:hypothetical protein
MSKTLKALLCSIVVALAASSASLMCFSPRLLVFTEEAPGSYEWTRGLNFLQQVEGQPVEEVEPALRHRLLPVYAARVLGLDGYAPLFLGWVGVIGLLAYIHALMGQLAVTRRVAISTVFLFASTSAVITSFGWLGIFDAWWVWALIIVAFAPQLWLVATVALLAPWIDERFIIGLPAAFVVRWLAYPWQGRQAARILLLLAVMVAPYAAWRFYSLLYSQGDASGDFLSLNFLVWVRLSPHGWWMAYRLAWVFLVLAFVLPNASRVKGWQLGAVCALTVIAAVVTAADLSRSAMTLAPLLLAGILLAWRNAAQQTDRWIPWLAMANFLVPYIHVVYNKLESAHPLPWEIIRLIKKMAAVNA